MEKFKENVLKLAKKLSALRVPTVEGEAKEPLLIWTTTPPCECDVPIIGQGRSLDFFDDLVFSDQLASQLSLEQ
jgi:hypothetical protein